MWSERSAAEGSRFVFSDTPVSTGVCAKHSTPCSWYTVLTGTHMSFLQLTLTYLATIPIFLAVDALWLATMAPRFYQAHIGHLLGPVQWAPAALFYLVYIVGIVLFAVTPAIEARAWWLAAGFGAIFGFIAYATYDLTNQATLIDWPLMVTLVDLAWGTFLTGTVATLSYLVAMRWIV